jgi:hypothetical protein
MPLFVRALRYEVVDALLSPSLKSIPELTTASTQTAPELLMVRRHGGPGLVMCHGQLSESLPGAGFRFASGRQNNPLEGFARFA